MTATEIDPDRTAPPQSVADGIWRLDTGYVRPGLAASYLIEGEGEYALVECGTGLSVPFILAHLDALNIAPDAVRYLIPTHVHLDHAGGAGGLMQALPQAQLRVHPRGLRHLVDPSRLLAGAMAVYGEEAFRRLNGEILACPEERSEAVEDGEMIPLRGRPLQVLDAPGHARHHLLVWDERSRGFFSGDVFGLCYPELQAGGRPFIAPTTTPVQFDPQAWDHTLDRIDAKSPDCMFLTHYGRVDGVATLSGELRERVHRHAEIAREQAEASEAELVAHLSEALYQPYQAQGGERSQAEFNAVLAMDLKLNAQGLKHWLTVA